MPTLLSGVSPPLRWNSLQHLLALGKLRFLVVGFPLPSYTSQEVYVHSPGLGHRPQINTHTDFGNPSEQLPLLQPLYPQSSAAPNRNYCLSTQQDHCFLRFPLTSPQSGKIPEPKSRGKQGLLSCASLLCLLSNTCKQLPHLFCLLRSCLWWEDFSVVVGSANDSPQCFSCENQPGPGMLMTKCLHLITSCSKKTFWSPDKSATLSSL